MRTITPVESFVLAVIVGLILLLWMAAGHAAEPTVNFTSTRQRFLESRENHAARMIESATTNNSLELAILTPITSPVPLGNEWQCLYAELEVWVTSSAWGKSYWLKRYWFSNAKQMRLVESWNGYWKIYDPLPSPFAP